MIYKLYHPGISFGKKIQSTKKKFKIKEEFSKSITCYKGMRNKAH